MLFENYPQLEHAYHIVLEFRNIYKQTNRNVAKGLFL
jgi:hypothetical protein